MKTRGNLITERAGVNFTRGVVEGAGSLFKEINLQHDFGQDATVILVVDGHVQSREVALQIKSGASYVSSGLCHLSATAAHIRFWAEHDLVTLGVVYDPSEMAAWWIDLQTAAREFRVSNGRSGTTFTYPKGLWNRFDATGFSSVLVPKLLGEAPFEPRSRLERPNHLVLNNPRFRKNRIAAFCEDLVSSPPDETSFIPFYGAGNLASWVSGAGIVQSTSSEFYEVWVNSNYFEHYEASLYALGRKGLEVQRLFVLTPAAMRDYKDQWHKVIVRHERLGLKPKFILHEDVGKINREVGIDCDAFGVVNKERMVLVKLNRNISRGGVILPFASPIMLQTIDKNLCMKASNVLRYYWKKARSPSHFRKWWGDLPGDLQASLEDELKRICFYASCLIDPE